LTGWVETKVQEKKKFYRFSSTHPSIT